MKKSLFKVISIILSVCFLLIFSSCSKISPENCTEHSGNKECKKCGINYFDELSSIIMSNATSTEEDAYMVEAVTDDVNCTIKYDSAKNTVYTALIYKNNSDSNIVFLLTMKPTTGTTYGWALSANGKMAGGTFQAEDVVDLVFRPSIDSNDFTTEEFSALNAYYEESISFCVDMLYSLLSNNVNNLKISDLGFENYSPNV